MAGRAMTWPEAVFYSFLVLVIADVLKAAMGRRWF